jgi:hypothetical protein
VGVSKFSGFSVSTFEVSEKTMPLSRRGDAGSADKQKASQTLYSGDSDPVPEVFSRLGFEWLYRLIRH